MSQKSKSFAKKTKLTGAILGVSFKWDDTKEETIFNLVDVIPKKILDEMPQVGLEMLVHGEAQKLGDLSSRPDVNTPSDMRRACNEVWESLKAGEWDIKRAPRGPMTPEERKAWLLKELAKLEGVKMDGADINL